MDLRERLGGLGGVVREKAGEAKEKFDLYKGKISRGASRWKRRLYGLFGKEIVEEPTLPNQRMIKDRRNYLWKLVCSGGPRGFNPYPDEVIGEELGIKLHEPISGLERSHKSKAPEEPNREDSLMWCDIKPYCSNLEEDLEEE